jgi:carbon-monoxide dehydrogenase medium subunit
MLKKFTYLSPVTTKELTEYLEKYGEKAKIIAGGTDLVVDMRGGRINPSYVVDIKKISEFSKISWKKDEGLSIGAAVTCIDLMTNSTIKKKFKFIADAAHEIGSPQLRNRATAVGNICTASPSGDLSRALLCMDGRVEIVSCEGKRVVKLDEFWVGVKRTQLKPNEFVSRIIIPPEMESAKGGHEKLKRIKGHDLAVASVSILKVDKKLRVSVGACAITPVVFEFPAKSSMKKVKDEVTKKIKPIDDIRASADYRRFMVGEYIERIMNRMKKAGDL